MGMMPDDAVLEYKHVNTMFPKSEPSKEKELGMHALETLERYMFAKKQKEEAETAEDLAKAELCNLLGDAEYGLMQDELVCTWKSASRESFDTKAFKAAHPALFDKFKKFSLEARIGPEITANHGIDHAGLRFFDTAPLHTEVLGLDQDG